jgi:lipopolysaccharide/colanic/teichoic acid biosynthesis glycosyltransferase
MTSSLISPPPNYYNLTQPEAGDRSSYCSLQWRRSQLLVKAAGKLKQPYLPALENQQLLVNCLKHTPVNLVSVDPKIGEDRIRLWAEACKQAHKPIFLRSGSAKPHNQPWGWLVRIIDWIFAFILLLLLSPIMLVLLVALFLSTSQSLFTYEWYVGEQGKLFRAIKFSTITKLGRWMRQYGLDNLPQLWNILRGDMGFIGSRCLTLEAAVRLNQRQLNQLSIITNSWEVEAESQLIISNS